MSNMVNGSSVVLDWHARTDKVCSHVMKARSSFYNNQWGLFSHIKQVRFYVYQILWNIYVFKTRFKPPTHTIFNAMCACFNRLHSVQDRKQSCLFRNSLIQTSWYLIALFNAKKKKSLVAWTFNKWTQHYLD